MKGSVVGSESGRVGITVPDPIPDTESDLFNIKIFVKVLQICTLNWPQLLKSQLD
jgi:hypothetical protein